MNDSVHGSGVGGKYDGPSPQEKPRASVRRGAIREYLEDEVYPRLSPEAVYDHPAHQWKERSSKKLKGG